MSNQKRHIQDVSIWYRIQENYVGRLAVTELIALGCFFYAFSAISPAMAQDMGWSVEKLFYALTCGFIMWAVCSPLAGHYIDKGYGPTMNRISMGFSLVLFGGMALSQSAVFTYICVGLLGIPMAFTMYESAFALLMRKIPNLDQAKSAILTVGLVAGASPMFIYPFVTIFEPIIGWRGMWVVIMGVVAMALVIFPHKILSDVDMTNLNRTPTTPQRPLSTRVIFVCLLLGFSFGFAMLAYIIFIFQLPTYLSQTNPKSIWMLMLIGPAQVIGRLAMSILQRYLSNHSMAFAMFIMMAFGVVVAWISGASPVTLWVSILTLGAGWGVCTILRSVIVSAYFTHDIVGRIGGTIAMCVLGFMAIGPSIGAFILSKFGFAVLCMVMFACLMMSILFLKSFLWGIHKI